MIQKSKLLPAQLLSATAATPEEVPEEGRVVFLALGDRVFGTWTPARGFWGHDKVRVDNALSEADRQWVYEAALEVWLQAFGQGTTPPARQDG